MGKMLKHYLAEIKNYFFHTFQQNEFAYVLYPFLRIYKLFGFVPIKLDPNELLNENYKYKVDGCTFMIMLIGCIIYIVGFCCGVNHLRTTHNSAQLHKSTIITYFTTWGQIVFLFVLGTYGLLNTWFNLPQMHRLFLWISRIDQQLEGVTGQELNYAHIRKKLFIQFFVVFLVPSTLSMVNCVVIHFGPDKVDMLSSCFWFVCFAPIMLLTFKEFQFYNLMFVLKTKFDIINGQLLQYGGDNLLACRKRAKENTILNAVKPECTSDVVCKLLEIFSNIADCADLLLNVFAWHLLLLTSASFGVITVQGYNLFAALILQTLEMDSYQLFVVTGWVLVQILVIGLNVGICCMTSKSIIAAVTTYLLIIIQFHFSSLQKKIT